MSYALACFLGALLIFSLEPFLGKALTPRFGGGAQVWMTCMVFFQVTLLLGYGWAFGIVRRLAPRRQAAAHATLLAAAFLLLVRQSFRGLPFIPFWTRPALGAATPLDLLIILATGCGLPMVALAASAPLLQTWFAYDRPGTPPYRLYAASNLGSLAALMAYPFLVEPWFGFTAQAQAAAGLFAVYLGLVVVLALRVPPGPAPTSGPAAALPWQQVGGWLVASGTGVMLLMAATDHLIVQAAAIPLIWVGPLALYLLTFVLVFEGRSFWQAPRTAFLWLLLLALSVLVMAGTGHGQRPLAWTLLGGHGVVWFGGLVCHGFLHRQRPPAAALTSYYLILALGGVLGGLMVAVAAPLVFTRPLEFSLAIVLAALIGGLARTGRGGYGRAWGPSLAVGLAAGWLAQGQLSPRMVYARDFYGVLRVFDFHGYRILSNGMTFHGAIALGEPDRALTYYGPGTGAARAIEALRTRKAALRVGVVGMGIGTLGLYARPGDAWTFYEISPAVLRIAGPASPYFPILRTMPGHPEVLLGDGRMLLERERRAGRLRAFDLLVVDAFSNDMVPWHLLTLEALDVYLDHLAPDGILAFHISNPMPLDRVVLSLARARNLYGGFHVQLAGGDASKPSPMIMNTTYVLMSRQPGCLRDPRILAGVIQGFGPRMFAGDHPDSALLQALAKDRAWTDDRSALSDLLLRRSVFTRTR